MTDTETLEAKIEEATPEELAKVIADLEAKIDRQNAIIHALTNPACGTCLFSGMHNNADLRGKRYCRKNAPGPDGWPVVGMTDECGDYKADLRKVAV